MDLAVLVLLGFAAYRLTRLIVIDAILDEPREWLFRRLGFKKDRKTGEWNHRGSNIRDKLVYLLSCTWCAGFWVSVIVYYAYFRNFHPVHIFAVAGVQGILHSLEPDDDD